MNASETVGVTDAMRAAEATGGFDLTHFGTVQRFEGLLRAHDLEYRGQRDTITETFVWSNGRGLILTTGNNPITGEYRHAGEREPEKGYASHIQVAGPESEALALYADIETRATYIKGKDPLRGDNGKDIVCQERTKPVRCDGGQRPLSRGDSDELEPEPGSRECPRIGIDQLGSTHYHDDEHERIIVIKPDGDPEHVETLDGRGVSEWVEYVRNRRGWDACFWEMTPFDGLSRELGQ